MRRRFGPVDGGVVESNSLALCLKPDLTFFTINPRVPRSRWKASAPILIEQSDVVIISLHDAGREQAQELMADIEGSARVTASSLPRPLNTPWIGRESRGDSRLGCNKQPDRARKQEIGYVDTRRTK